jgi:D-alanine-D-alanine ligase
MKIAVVYNRESKSVINLFGMANQEKIGLKTIRTLSDALRAGGHQVQALEGDKDLIEKLEEFMPRVLQGERPGMVFNVSYGIQGQARYTHVPSILEMVGVPYVGSGPLAHSLALDKVVAKMIFKGKGLPTPGFAVLDQAGFDLPSLEFPLIVKPKNEAVSFGIQVVRDENELREAADVIFKRFRQPVLAERYIEGREINVGLLGNNPPDALPPAEILFGAGGPAIYTYEDKTRKSGREIDVRCPADLDPQSTERVQEIARGAFSALGCYDCARVDLRMDKEGNFYILEVNSLPSLGEHGSFVQGAAAVGLDFPGLVNRLVEVASARYFGTPTPPRIEVGTRDPREQVFAYLTQRRDHLERRVAAWTRISSRTTDPVGLRNAVRELEDMLVGMRLKPAAPFTDERSVYCWETSRGMKDGTLLIGHLDIPLDEEFPVQGFRRDPEWLHGEGVGSSRSALAMLEYALRSLRTLQRLHRIPLGVLYYLDEGRDCRYSAKLIREAAAHVKRVLVLRPGNIGDRVITQRRGQRKYRLIAEEPPRRPGRASKKPEIMRWIFERLETASSLSSPKDRISVSVVEMSTRSFPILLPHRVTAGLLLTYGDSRKADEVETRLRELLRSDGNVVSFEAISDRPPMKEQRGGLSLYRSLQGLAERWEIPIKRESSVWPSAAGLVPSRTAVLCGVGPVAQHLYTPQEAVKRISLVQRTLLLAEFLCEQAESSPPRPRPGERSGGPKKTRRREPAPRKPETRSGSRTRTSTGKRGKR